MTSMWKGFLKQDHSCCKGKRLMLSTTTIKQRALIHHKAPKESEKISHTLEKRYLQHIKHKVGNQNI